MIEAKEVLVEWSRAYFNELAASDQQREVAAAARNTVRDTEIELLKRMKEAGVRDMIVDGRLVTSMDNGTIGVKDAPPVLS